jgi:hypothetical protein
MVFFRLSFIATIRNVLFPFIWTISVVRFPSIFVRAFALVHFTLIDGCLMAGGVLPRILVEVATVAFLFSIHYMAGFLLILMVPQSAITFIGFAAGGQIVIIVSTCTIVSLLCLVPCIARVARVSRVSPSSSGGMPPLSIARAVLSPPSVKISPEPTSAAIFRGRIQTAVVRRLR